MQSRLSQTGRNSTKESSYLRNALHAGRLLWNRARTVIDPVTGTEVWRARPEEVLVETPLPHLRIIPEDL
ncbi:hypothetical protein [Roseomonas sp. HF4]|uniref:hypothetical protein n=1 Tax=Roseomonas sp. HF4 TaxID=2562313 RepID=UPI0010BFA99A|nr:hypothetical protein [Roseomonas sp. HF4]